MVVMLSPSCITASVRHEVDPPPVDDHRAGAALAVVAALLGAGQMQVLAQRIEQGGARVELKLLRGAVHGERHLGHRRRRGRGRRTTIPGLGVG